MVIPVRKNVVANLDMPHQPYATGEHAMLADFGAAGDPHTRGHGGVVTDLDVVSDLNLVVELHTIADNGIGQCAAIDSGIYAYFHVIADRNTADLGDFSARHLSRWQKPKPSPPSTAPD